MPPVIFSEYDFDIVSYYDSRPNYITSKKVQGNLILLIGETQSQSDITGKIVLLESADPGYDWIFAKKPSALITKYGGPASHMSIRCAELGLPAAIGIGDILYEMLIHVNFVSLDCEKQKIEQIGNVH